jgi:YegS/Rv2252/BmrU family lipid kinase
MDTPFPLAILPVGSVNVLARELGLPRSLAAAARVAAAGELRAIDLGVANGRPFALMAGVGFDAAVVHSLAPQIKNLIGSFAYVARGLALLARYRPSRFRITADGETIETEAWLAVVANTPRYTYRWRLAPEAAMDDGWLDLCLFQSSSPREMAGQVAAALRNRHTKHPGVRHLQARRFRFECEPAVCVQLDGDPEGLTPLEIRVAPRALRVVVPPA